MTAPQVETLFASPPEQLAAVRRLMLGALLRREVALADAEDAVQDVLEAIARRPENFALFLAHLAEHGSYFIGLALDAYLNRLWREQRRRDRERRHAAVFSGAGDPIDGEDFAAWSAAVADARLTPRQRLYLQRLLSGWSVLQIAAAANTSPQAVKAILRRAVASIRQHAESATSTPTDHPSEVAGHRRCSSDTSS